MISNANHRSGKGAIRHIIGLVLPILVLSCSSRGIEEVPEFDCNCTSSFHYDILERKVVLPSSYDTEEFKERLIEQMMAGFGEEPGDGFWYGMFDFRYDFYPRLIESFTFEADTDFVLLAYYPCETREKPDGSRRHSTGGPKRLFFAGYVKSTNGLYLLSDGFGPSAEESFNRMLNESGSVPHLSEVCRASLLLKVKYAQSKLAVVRNRKDVDAWYNFTVRRSTDVSDELLRSGFVTFFPSRDSGVREYVDRFSSADSVGGLPASYKNRPIKPPSVSLLADTFHVVLTVYASLFPDISEELATWEVAFEGTGEVISMRYLEPPVIAIRNGPFDFPGNPHYADEEPD